MRLLGKPNFSSADRSHYSKTATGKDRPGSILQRYYTDNGKKITGSEFTTTLANNVKIISFADRHTIMGLLKNKGGAKKLNTVVLKPVEMQTVAQAAYNIAWSDELGKLSVTDGTTFQSEGITWGIDARPSEPSIHIYPTESPPHAIDIGKLLSSLKSYVAKRENGVDHDDALAFAKSIAVKTGGDEAKLVQVVTALQSMGEVG